MAYSNEQSFEEVIRLLGQFMNSVLEDCSALKRAGQDCIDNTGEDDMVIQANEKLGKSVADIVEAVKDIQNITIELKDEWESTKATADKINFVD